MNALTGYIENARILLLRALEEQQGALERAARLVMECVTGGGLLYAFGTGHSHMLAEELFYRAGGLAACCPILDEKLMLHASATGSTQWERTPGNAERLLREYPCAKGDVMLVCSNSGRNAAPVEMAACAKARGMSVIALTNVAHSGAVSPRNPQGLRLFELADVVLDNCGAIGDACMDVGIGRSVGATSTVVGAALLEAVACRAIELAAQMNRPVDVYSSGNVDAGDEINERILGAYRSRIRFL
ncbi:MAG: SIS domain-containing protein [Clostridiales bacterium]|nr:SIS domain-containing protein [Clostridiales bacterium]